MSLSVEEFLSRFEGVVSHGEGDWTARCPAHDDHNASLHITLKSDGEIMFNCFGGCEGGDIVRAAGLRWSEIPGKGGSVHTSAVANRPSSVHPIAVANSRLSHASTQAVAMPMENHNTVNQENFTPAIEEDAPVARSFGRYGLSLAEYAEYKKISEDALKSFQVHDGWHVSKSGHRIPCVDIRYLDQDGNYCRSRHRMALRKTADDTRFLWDARKEVPMRLYGLWRMDPERKTVIVVEGESDCHTLWAGGFSCLGIPGVSLYKPERDDPFLTQFRTAYCHIEPDHGGWNLFRRLTGEDGRGGSYLKDTMKFFSLPGFKDPSEAWMAMDGDVPQFQALIRNAMQNARGWREFPRPAKWRDYEAALREKAEMRAARKAEAMGASAQPEGDGAAAPAPRGGKGPDYVGAAMAFLDGARDEAGGLLLVQWRNGWYERHGNCWREVVRQDLENRVFAFMQNTRNQAEFRLKCSSAECQNILANLSASGNCGIPQATRMPAWISLAREGLDAGYAEGMLPMGNCILDIEKAAAYTDAAWSVDAIPADEDAAKYTMPNTPDLLCTYAMEYGYDASAGCPRFLEWLAQVMPQEDMRECFQMMLGLLLVPDTSFNVCFWLYGEGGTGKTTALRIVEALVGRENICHVPLVKMGERFQSWPLAEHLVNVVGEMPTDDPQGKIRAIEGDFKDSISGEYIDCERKGRDVVRAKCTARHLFACNQLPKFYDKSNGVWDRLRIFPFNQVFRNTKNQVRNIERTFLPDELPGIFNFALVGLAKLRRLNAFPESPEMAEAKGIHRENCDTEGEYLRLFCKADKGAFVSCAELFQHYRGYLMDNGFQVRTAKTLEAAVWRIYRVRPAPLGGDSRIRVYRGIHALWKDDETSNEF